MQYNNIATQLIANSIIFFMQAPISISGINVDIQFFTIQYLISGSVCDSEMIELNSQDCAEDVCTAEYNVTSTTCTINTDSDIIVTVSATSELGTGQESQSRIGKELPHA